MKKNTISLAQNQKGAALITSLIFLVIMTMLALSSMNMNLMDEKMASNTQQQNRLFQAAETGLVSLLDDAESTNLLGSTKEEYPARATLQNLEDNWTKDTDIDEQDIAIYYDAITTITTVTGSKTAPGTTRSATANSQEDSSTITFEMTSIALNTANESRRTIVSGAWKTIPRSNN